MSLKLGTNDISQAAASIKTGANNLDRIYDGTKLVWERGVAFSTTFGSMAGFTTSSTGSGIGTTSGEAYWNGTTDGYGSAEYLTTCNTNNQYVGCVIGSYTNNSRASGLFMHDDGGLGGYYAVGFTTASTQLVYTTGRWQQNSITSYATTSGIASGDMVEMWNIGTTFYVAINTVIKITQTISGAQINNRHYQGFGMYRASFASSQRLADWYGGDAGANGKI